MTVVHDDNFIPGTPSTLCIYETVHGRVQLCAPVLNYSFPRETAFLLFFLLLCRIGREKRAPFFPTFLLSFFLSTFFSDVQSGQEEIRPFSWRNILEILRAESLFWFFSRIFFVKQRISRLEFLFVEAVLFSFRPDSQEIPEEKNTFLPSLVKITDSRRYVSLESVIVSKFLYFLVTIERYVPWPLKAMINFLHSFNIVKSFMKSV